MRNVGRRLKEWLTRPLVRDALVAYALFRVGLTLWTALVLTVVPLDVGIDSPAQPYLGSKPVTGGVSELLLGPWQRFDTTHYLHLAREGYRLDEPVFSIRLPLYPALVRWLGALFKGDHRYLVAALFISSTATLGYFLVLAALARDALDAEETRRALLYVSAYPWAFFLLAGYAESLFLFLTTVTLWASRHRHWWVAGSCGALAALTRVQGVILVFPLVLEALRQRRFRFWPLPWQVLWSSLPGLATLGFLFWRSAAGFRPMPSVYAEHLHNHVSYPWTSLLHTLRSLCCGGGHVNDYLDFGAALLFLALTLIAWRRLSPVYALYMSGVWILSVSHVQAVHPLMSVGRYMLSLFPALFLLGRVGARNAWLNRLILYPSLMLLMFLSANFTLWGWSG